MDTTPDKIDPATVEGYEPPVEGEDRKAARARKARNRRRAEKVQREQAAALGEPVKPVGRPPAKTKREQAVLGILTGAGVAVMAFDEFDGATIIEGAPDLAAALAKAAEKNSKLAKALDSLTQTSAWAEVGLAAAAIVVPIVKHHAVAPIDRQAATTDTTTDTGMYRPSPPEPAEPAEPSGVSESAPVFTVGPTPPADVPTFEAQ